jgi:mRNA interferase RelE/StbE
MKNSGEKPYKIEYLQVAQRDARKIPEQLRPLIAQAIYEKLSTRPDVFGKPLKSILYPLWSLRVKNWRVVFLLKGGVVQIWAILPRSVIYKEVQKRKKL